MIPIWVLALVSRVPNYSRELSKADGLLAQEYPLPNWETWFYLDQAVEAYSKIRRRFGNRPRVMVGLGRAYEQLGEYRNAQQAFERAGQGHRDELREVELQIRAKRALAPLFPKRKVLQVIQNPSRPGVWGGLVAGQEPGTGVGIERPMLLRPEFVLFQFDRRSKAHVTVQKELSPGEGDGEEYGPTTCNLYWTALKQGENPAAVVYSSYPGADNDTADLYVYQIKNSKIRREDEFHSSFGIAAYGSTARQDFHLALQATWHTWWTDVYSWTSHGFRLANARYPRLYSDHFGFRGDRQAAYSEIAISGTTLAIHRRYREALKKWRQAKRLGDDKGAYYGNYGEPDEIDKAIDLRIDLLKRGRYADWRIYRPYDFDTEAPPMQPFVR